MRTKLIRTAADEHVLLLNVHHIVFDGWSAGVLLSELSQLYAAFRHGESSPLAPLPLQYADFALWQRRWLAGERLEKQLAFWRKQLVALPDLELPSDAEPPARPTYRGAIESFRVPPELTGALKQLSRDHEATLFMTLLAAFKALLHRYTAQEDIVVSSPAANRRRTELEGLIGFFVNSLVLRTDLSGQPTFRELLRRVRAVALAAFDHQDLPFERLVEELRPERMATHNPLFRAAFSLQNTPVRSTPPPELEIIPLETHNRTAKFDLVFAIYDTGEALAAEVEYSTELFRRGTIRDMVALYCRLLECVASDPDQRLLEIPLPGWGVQQSRAALGGGNFDF